jgi:hypothetical protein
MARIGRSVVLEQVPFETLKRDGAEKPGRHDPVRIDIVPAEWKTTTGN